MSVTLTGTGGYFTREGIISAGVRDANLFLGSTDLIAAGLRSIGVRSNNTVAQYQSALQNEVDGLYTQRDSVRSSLSAWKSYLQTLSQNTTIDQVHADAVLVSKDLLTALNELIRQMIGSGTMFAADNDINANAVSASVAAVSTNVGNGVCMASVKRIDGRSNELVIAEIAEAICSSDAGLGATARSEPFNLLGEVTQTDTLAFDWPMGSGSSTSVTTTDSAIDASANMLTNSDFETFTVTDTPDNWTIRSGAASTDVFKEPTNVYRTSHFAVKMITVAASTPAIDQGFNASSGTTAVLLPNTSYALNGFIRNIGSTAQGVLTIDLYDVTNSAVMTDDSGTSLALTIAHNASGTSTSVYKSIGKDITLTSGSAVFVTPKSLPASYRLRIRTSTAYATNEGIYIADVALVQMTSMYTNGPLVAIFAGSTPFVKGDQFHVTIANDYGGVFQTYLGMKLFDMRSLGIQFPSDSGGTETINDSLVT